MKPEVSTVQPGFEYDPTKQGPSVERVPAVPGSERGIETGAERKEQIAEASAIAADAGLPLILPPPIVVDDSVVIISTVPSDTPLIAGDDDLIEKEWVDRAKKIVTETRNDPYSREEAVSKLQSDYLKKRYGRELGAAD